MTRETTVRPQEIVPVCSQCGSRLVEIRPDVLCVNDHKHVRCPRCSPPNVGGCWIPSLLETKK